MRAISVIAALFGILSTSDAQAQGATSAIEPVEAKEQFGFVLRPATLRARAIGSYARGCLAGAKMLPINGPVWQAMRLSRNRNWGHPALVSFLQGFAGDANKLLQWQGLLIGDMSQPRGGPMLSGHRSHQIGLDADIWYMPMPPHELTYRERELIEARPLAHERGTKVIAGAWSRGYLRLLKLVAGYPQVERVLVHPAVKRALCENAGKNRGWLSKVRPIHGHNFHFHVRLACPKDLAGCLPQKEPPVGDGCGKPLEDWLKLVSRPPRPILPPRPGMIPKKPRMVTLANLPAACGGVLSDGAPSFVAAPAFDRSVPLPVRKTRFLALRR